MCSLHAKGNSLLEGILTRESLPVKRVSVVSREHADLRAIASDFELADEDGERLPACLSWRYEPGVSFITKESQPTFRRSLGFVGLKGTVVVFEKEQHCSSEEAERSFVIDSRFLRAVKLLIKKVLDLEVTGWIEEVFDDIVKVCYYDENAQFVFADIPREKFSELPDLRNGTHFRFQIRQEGDFPEYDILPVRSDDRGAPRPSLREFLRLGLASEKLEEAGEPTEPTNWSDAHEVNRYLGKLEEKYKGTDWGRGSRK